MKDYYYFSCVFKLFVNIKLVIRTTRAPSRFTISPFVWPYCLALITNNQLHSADLQIITLHDRITHPVVVLSFHISMGCVLCSPVFSDRLSLQCFACTHVACTHVACTHVPSACCVLSFFHSLSVNTPQCT